MTFFSRPFFKLENNSYISTITKTIIMLIEFDKINLEKVDLSNGFPKIAEIVQKELELYVILLKIENLTGQINRGHQNYLSTRVNMELNLIHGTNNPFAFEIKFLMKIHKNQVCDFTRIFSIVDNELEYHNYNNMLLFDFLNFCKRNHDDYDLIKPIINKEYLIQNRKKILKGIKNGEGIENS